MQAAPGGISTPSHRVRRACPRPIPSKSLLLPIVLFHGPTTCPQQHQGRFRASNKSYLWAPEGMARLRPLIGALFEAGMAAQLAKAWFFLRGSPMAAWRPFVSLLHNKLMWVSEAFALSTALANHCTLRGKPHFCSEILPPGTHAEIVVADYLTGERQINGNARVAFGGGRVPGGPVTNPGASPVAAKTSTYTMPLESARGLQATSSAPFAPSCVANVRCLCELVYPLRKTKRFMRLAPPLPPRFVLVWLHAPIGPDRRSQCMKVA